MSEEKLYAIRNNVGKYLTIERTAPWWDSQVGTTVRNIDVALAWAGKHGGHVVTLIEEPKKVVLSEEQAKIVERAHSNEIPASFIASKSDDEEMMMNAYVNGYTVAKDKKYLVYKELDGKQKNKLFAQAYRSSIYFGTISWILTNEVKSGSWAQFTESEIEHYGLQDCEKEEVTDDDD
ncbi:DUF1642 domain-containing protein [Lacticaseibacillus paracasei]|uniref:DUF1642 domain-containing protein n=1 Tax=Lacticaseibacillus paracasei TaxID=1597 RepID=UPI003DA9FBCC